MTRLNSKDQIERKRIVVKIGTSSLVGANGELSLVAMNKLVVQIAALANAGHQVLVVSSGAVGAGLGKLGLPKKPDDMAKKQALAAIGQGILMQQYERLFEAFGVNVAQVLLSKEDFANRDRYVNIKNTLAALFDYDVVPIINENDTTCFAELKLGDNDNLAALIAALCEADLLILLSDIDGLYTANPRTNKDAKLLSVVEELTPEVYAMAGDPGSSLGTGGMTTKLQAATIATHCGLPMVLANAATENAIVRIVNGEGIGTRFLPASKSFMGKKVWLAYAATSRGRIIVDAGAAKALIEKGSSLLPGGVVGTDGSFIAGEIVTVCAAGDDKVIARGYTGYSSAEIELLKGKHSSEIGAILNREDCEPDIIHRDYMSVIG